jgi:glycerol-3-phosphate dehydrogenase
MKLDDKESLMLENLLLNSIERNYKFLKASTNLSTQSEAYQHIHNLITIRTKLGLFNIECPNKDLIKDMNKAIGWSKYEKQVL